MKIQVIAKTNYGSNLIYPVCETAFAFASLAGKKTLNRTDLTLIRKIGFEIEEIHEDKVQHD